MALIDYKITEDDMRDDYGFEVANFLGTDAKDKVQFLIDRAWGLLLNRLYELNHDCTEDDDFEDLLDNQSKQDGFEFAQYLIIHNILTLGDVNPITIEVDTCLRSRCKLSKMNGYQL